MNTNIGPTFHSLKHLLAVLCLVLFCALALTPLVQAATITVTSTADRGDGSLRQAIADATSGDIIAFTNTLSGQTITLTRSSLVLSNELTIVVPGPAELAISGSNARRVFEISPGVTNTISGLTIANGKAPDGSGGNPGQPGDHGGGIYNDGTLTLSNCVVRDNRAGKPRKETRIRSCPDKQ